MIKSAIEDLIEVAQGYIDDEVVLKEAREIATKRIIATIKKNSLHMKYDGVDGYYISNKDLK